METAEHRPEDLVLWSDPAMLVVNKPAGVLVNPGGFSKRDQSPNVSLREILEPRYGRLWLAHRLDRDTSGVLVLARAADAHRALNAQFQEHAPLKMYHALVIGTPAWTEKTVDLALLPNGDRKHRTIVPRTESARRKAKHAQTNLRVLERFSIYTLIQACPQTGRTHQIRAHLAALELPIVADLLYGGTLTLPGLTRQALHAHSLTLRHPRTRQELRFEAPYPQDLAQTLDQLRRANHPGP